MAYFLATLAHYNNFVAIAPHILTISSVVVVFSSFWAIVDSCITIPLVVYSERSSYVFPLLLVTLIFMDVESIGILLVGLNSFCFSSWINKEKVCAMVGSGFILRMLSLTIVYTSFNPIRNWIKSFSCSALWRPSLAPQIHAQLHWFF